MTPQEKITKLEGLLVRVKERTDVRRHSGVAFAPKATAPVVAASPAAPVVAASAAPAPTPQDVHDVHAAVGVHAATTAVIEDSVVEDATLHLPTTPPGADVFVPEPAKAAAKPMAMSLPPMPETSGWSDPPPPETTLEPDTTIVSHAGVGASLDDSDVDVEVSTEVVEIDIDEPGLEHGLAHGERSFVPAESGAQPVAEHVRADDDRLPEDLPEELVATATSLPDPLDVPPPPPPANEVIEPEPSSSPRPIATEAADAYGTAESAYEEESAPRHTPPPESGKQVAAPSVRPEPLRKPSLPPEPISGPSFGGTSGWREPGISLPREPSRVPPAATTSYPSSIPPDAATIAPAAPEITRAALPGDANVVAIEGTAASFSPATFGELLDATLSL